jgi:hypothetical protein
MLEVSKARWFGTSALKTGSRKEWKKSLGGFKKSISLGRQLLVLLESGSNKPLPVTKPIINNKGTEIIFADEAPVCPEVCPVMVLKGSSYEMGYQYAQQVVQIYGTWMLERKTGRTFSAESLAELKKWEEQVAQKAPEILEMCRGWAKGAEDAGVPLSYYDVVDIWVGHAPPKSSYMGRSDELTDNPPAFACSGAAAWGRATPDGKLVTGSSGDHDPSFPAIIMGYPDTGNSFMFTTFSAVGDITMVGGMHMFGHPGMNNKGLAYVEHGGQPRMIEPKKYWGYGIRRATSVLHILRYANNAHEALKMEMEAPIGDVGMDNYTIGGFYADSNYGYVLESRKEPVALREAGYMGETDFLYANNSAMHREASKAGWMQEDQAKNGDWEWDEHAGWSPRNFQGLHLADLFKGGDGQARVGLRGMYYGSARRNRFHYNFISKAIGKIDTEFMKMMFRYRGIHPDIPWKEKVSNYNKNGGWGEITIGHAGNGIITITKPDNGPNGIYSVCVGQAARGLNGNSPFFASYCPMYNETNTFWELKLAETPKAAVTFARAKAKEFLETAKNNLSKMKLCNEVLAYMNELLKEADDSYRQGEIVFNSSESGDKNKSLYQTAKSIRSFLKTQAKALQVSEFLNSPPAKPEEL